MEVAAGSYIFPKFGLYRWEIRKVRWFVTVLMVPWLNFSLIVITRSTRRHMDPYAAHFFASHRDIQQTFCVEICNNKQNKILHRLARSLITPWDKNKCQKSYINRRNKRKKFIRTYKYLYTF